MKGRTLKSNNDFYKTMLAMLFGLALVLPIVCCVLWIPNLTPEPDDPGYYHMRAFRWVTCLLSCILRIACFRCNLETTLLNDTIAVTRTAGPVDRNSMTEIAKKMRILRGSFCVKAIESLAPLLMSLILVLTHKSALDLNLGVCEALTGSPDTLEAAKDPAFNVMRNTLHGKALGFLVWWDQTSWFGTVLLSLWA